MTPPYSSNVSLNTADDVFAYVTNPTQFHEWQKASSPVA